MPSRKLLAEQDEEIPKTAQSVEKKRKRDDEVKPEAKGKLVTQAQEGKKKQNKDAKKKSKHVSDSEDSSSSDSSSDSEVESKKQQKGKKPEAKKPEVKKVEAKEEGKKAEKKKVEKKAEETVASPETDEWRKENNMTILGSDCPAPFTSFGAANFPEYINKSIKQLGFAKPTPIQAQGWPLALKSRDIIGIAETGSGKTLAFILPAIVHTINKANRKGPSVLVLAPTRELAQQIEEVTNKTCTAAGLKSCCVYGGVAKGPQAAQISTAEVIIATPGRLLDLMEDGAVRLNNVSYLVLDEADRMLDMGFEVQINRIMTDVTYKGRQTLMYSATWPSDVQRLAQKFFTNPIRITIGSENLSGAKKVTQIVQVCENDWEKRKKFKELLKSIFKDNCKILVFMLYKKSCEAMGNELLREGFPCVAIHGDKQQGARNKAIEDFKSGATPILVATDVAARGLDIKGVQYVINVEFPLKCEDYVHRIGRTGRAGMAGTAYTLFTAEDKVHARELVQIMQESGQTVDPKLLAIADKAPGIQRKKSVMEQMYGDYAKNVDATAMQKKATRIVFD